jgi:hypothetical protein
MYCVGDPFWIWVHKWVSYWRQPDEPKKKTQILVLGSLLWFAGFGGGTMRAVRRAGAWGFHPLRKAAGQD